MFKFEEKTTERTDYIVGNDWASLKKTWKDYKKAKENFNVLRMRQYANKIKNLQKKLGLRESRFIELDPYLEPLYK